MRFLNNNFQNSVKQPSKILFCVDREPDAGQNILGGWVTSRALPIKLQLHLDGRCIHEFACTIPRMDVFKGFSDIPGSLLSGFELVLPENVLGKIGSGRLTVVALCPDGEQQIWSWKGGQENDPTAAIAIAEHFVAYGQLESVSSSEAINLKGPVSLTTVLASNGVYSSLLKTINQLQKLLAKCKAGGLELELNNFLISVPSEDERQNIANFLKSNGAPLNPAPQFIVPDKFQGWNEFAKNQKQKSAHLVFFAEEGVDLSALDLSALIRDFSELSTVQLLMPALYHERLGIQGPTGVNTRDLRSLTSVRGANIPVLYPTKRVGPAWLSSLDFLASSQKKTGLRPLEELFLYHVDLRQVISSREMPFEFLSAEDRAAISLFAKHELEVKKRKDTKQNVVVLLSAEQGIGHPGRQFERQVAKLTESLENDGVGVTFVQDTEGNNVRYFLDHVVLSLEDYLAQFSPENAAQEAETQVKLDWVIATSWDQIRAANVLRYILNAKVGFFIDEVKSHLFNEQARDSLEVCQAAYRGTFLPLVNSSSVQSEVSAVNPCGLFAVNLPYVLDPSVFSNWGLTRQSGSVLIALGDSVSCPLDVIELYKSVVLELKAKDPSVTISFFNYAPHSRELSELIELGDQTFGPLSIGDIARLYNTHSILIDFQKQRGIYSQVADAAACGLPSLVCSERGSLDFGVSVAPGTVTCRADAQEIVFSINKILKDAVLLGELEKANREFVIKLRARFPENLLSTLDSKYNELIAKLSSERAERRNISIVIPVYNALDATVMCLRSVLNHAPNDIQLVVVNDCSDFGTSERLQHIAGDNPRIQLIELQKNLGFVRACIAGVEACNPENDIILLNSDVVLTKSSLELLQDAAYSNFDVAVASSLSTNSPHLEIKLNVGDSLDDAAEKIFASHTPTHPTVITAEGQFLYIRRWALESFGFFDTVFNRGFCEESDMCMRMFLNGCGMVAADNALISHRKSASFGKEGGLVLKRENRPIFDARWGRYYALVYPIFRARNPLGPVREKYYALAPRLEGPRAQFTLTDEVKRFAFQSTSASSKRQTQRILADCDVVFILPAVILGGGALSVVQHVNELLMRGVKARVISLKEPEVPDYPQLAPAIPVSVEELFELDWSTQKVIATFWSTAYLVKGLTMRYPELEGYYYIQDYEPWFYSIPEEFLTVKDAEKSFELGLRGVAKTQFLRELVQKQHNNVDVELITPGISDTVFYPGLQDEYFGRPRAAALYRPKTTRRGNKELLQLIKLVKARVPELEINLFGQTDDLPYDIQDLVVPRGRLHPDKVGDLYRATDIVIDLSYWQGFGRMGLEGMASGAVPVLSRSGGISRYAEDERNAFIVDLDDLSAAAEKVIRLAKDRSLRLQMRAAGIESARRFTERLAVDDWLKLWKLSRGQSALVEKFLERPHALKAAKTLTLVHEYSERKANA